MSTNENEWASFGPNCKHENDNNATNCLQTYHLNVYPGRQMLVDMWNAPQAFGYQLRCPIGMYLLINV